MGSGKKRKLSDETIIQPKEKKTVNKLSGGEGGGSNGQGANYSSRASQCPIILKVKLPKNTKVSEGMELKLKIEGGSVGIYYKNILINKLTVKANVILNCINLGFKYDGAVISTSGGFYVYFKRSTD